MPVALVGRLGSGHWAAVLHLKLVDPRVMVRATLLGYQCHGAAGLDHSRRVAEERLAPRRLGQKKRITTRQLGSEFSFPKS